MPSVLCAPQGPLSDSHFARGCRRDASDTIRAACGFKGELHARPEKQRHANEKKTARASLADEVFVSTLFFFDLVRFRFPLTHEQTLSRSSSPTTTTTTKNSPSPPPPRRKRSSTPATRGSPPSSTPRSPTSNKKPFSCRSRSTTRSRRPCRPSRSSD